MAFSIRAFAPPTLRNRWPVPLRRATSLLAAGFLVVVVVTAILADRLAPHPFAAQDLTQALKPPSGTYPLGTDNLGRDVLSRLIYGARVSLAVAVTVEAVELFFGLALGMLAGLKGGWLDNLVMRF